MLHHHFDQSQLEIAKCCQVRQPNLLPPVSLRAWSQSFLFLPPFYVYCFMFVDYVFCRLLRIILQLFCICDVKLRIIAYICIIIHKNKSKTMIKRYIFTTICIIAILVLSFFPVPEMPDLEGVPLIDKWTHMVMYCGLMLFLLDVRLNSFFPFLFKSSPPSGVAA